MELYYQEKWINQFNTVKKKLESACQNKIKLVITESEEEKKKGEERINNYMLEYTKFKQIAEETTTKNESLSEIN